MPASPHFDGSALKPATVDDDGFVTGWLPADTSDADYHRGAMFRHPSLSYSIAKMFHTRRTTPAHVKAVLDGRRSTPTEAQQKGTIKHHFALGTHEDFIVVVKEFNNWRTKASKAVRAEIEASGKIALIESRAKREIEDGLAFRQHLVDNHGIDLHTAYCERAIAWVERASDGTKVQCRAKLDIVCAPPAYDQWLVPDLKAPGCAHPEEVAEAVRAFGYDIQIAAYPRAVAMVQELDLDPGFLLVSWEVNGSGLASCTRIDGEYREYGLLRWRTAVERFARCLNTGVWPGFQKRGEVQVLNLEHWQRDEMARLRAELGLSSSSDGAHRAKALDLSNETIQQMSNVLKETQQEASS